MSNSIQETDQEPMNKHSYVKNGGSNSNNLGYELRKGPKKTPKVKDTNNCFVVLDKVCKECGKGIQSWKALFGHMKCHSKKVSNNQTKYLNQDSWTSHSDDENSGAKSCGIKQSRNKRNKRYIASSSISMNANNNNNNNNNRDSSNHASTSIVSGIEQDQESEVAMCLMMLSRDEGRWDNEIESSGHCKSYAFVRLTKTDGQKPVSNGYKIKKSVETKKSEVGSTGLEKIVIENDGLDDENELGFAKSEDSSKRKFECITCNKSFHSYQALGGHKASHKKLKEIQDSKTEGENTIEHKPMFNHDNLFNGFSAKPSFNHQLTNFNLGVGSLKKPIVLGAHECPICLKVFSSGQALGGHKRSHMITEAKLNQQTNMNLIEKVNEPIREIRGFLDLNMLPDTMEEDMIMNRHWADATNHESTTLLGLLSTS
ncbi:hypothetical protein L1987_47326 [Smallanthus sonchifolius]|uniref:Uncharacterized protein n=1 Tax=Smallanthus sonchifolius TaxID=185202 RepID=A0ACB9G366_9ASTR|nr:hypothetical protein L1987_47326 [Smallanthus sonchifolius]